MASGYGQGAVLGTAAYDFNHIERFSDEYAGQSVFPQVGEAAEAEGEAGAESRQRARTAAKSRQGIAPFAILGFLVAAFLFVIGISAQVRLFSLSDESVALEGRLEELEREQTRLRIAYESAFNLAQVEEYATERLGMQKPSADQVTYIDTSAADRAVVLDDGASDSLVDRAADMLSGLGEYLR